MKPRLPDPEPRFEHEDRFALEVDPGAQVWAAGPDGRAAADPWLSGQ
jgi:hypothetical protein